ncbi:alpha/beta fold hydrolase [Streptomyces sp. NPDC087440]|uniref:alpha/beta fold hydrolase n=1 Tax=Streptomyces sp. NPDC087440 TaxID=3365790 RepID=UPI0037F6D4F4
MTDNPAPGRRSLLKGGVAAALALGVTPLNPARASAGSAAGLRLRLPAPTGPYAVGAEVAYLVDRSRNDPWTPAIGVRELMVTVLRPAAPGPGHRPHPAASGGRHPGPAAPSAGHHPGPAAPGAGRHPRLPQLTPAAAKAFAELAPLVRAPYLPGAGVDWAATLTHARTGTTPLPGPRPTLLYSPGGGDSRTMGSVLATELASHGWTVVTVDHPGDASQVEFPGVRPGRPDRVRGTELRPNPDAATFRTMIGTRVADLRFVLDALRPAKVGLYGHSAGGTAVAQAFHEDRRVAAAVNLEGYLDGLDGELFPVARHRPDRPLLLAGTDGFRDARIDRSWSALLAHGGPVARRELAHANHWAFTDYAALVPQLQRAGLMTAEQRTGMVGAARPETAGRLVRDFFARHLPV